MAHDELARMFRYEHMRRVIGGLDDLETLRAVALKLIDHMETERRALLEMTRPSRSPELPNVPRP